MRSSSLSLPLALALVSCGRDPEPPPAASAPSSGDEALTEAQRIYAEAPEEPMHVAARYSFTPPQACAQGPWTLTVPAVASPFSEGFTAYACVRHDIRGDVRVVAEGRDPYSASSFGYEHAENARCVATEAERARLAGGSTPGGSASSPSAPGPAASAAQSASAQSTPRGRRGRAPEPAPPAPDPLASTLPVAEPTFDECPAGTRRVGITSMTFQAYEGPALAAGARIGIELWAAEPNDLEGAVFVLEHRVVDAGVTAKSFRAYLGARAAWSERYRAAFEADRGRTSLADFSPGADAPPPPLPDETPPPRPSVNAVWVAGYWHSAETWVFLPGFWRVPPSDVARDLTVHAPAPPPAPRQEMPPPPPAPTAVWTPGFWQWSGSTYVWVEGAYRIPPAAGQTWKPNTWRATVRGAVFVPGGWSFGAD